MAAPDHGLELPMMTDATGKWDVQPTRVADDKEDTKETEAIIRGLGFKRVLWYGDPLQDYLFYVRQMHIVLGIFFCHRMHTYTQSERFLVWASSALASWGIIAWAMPESCDPIDEFTEIFASEENLKMFIFAFLVTNAINAWEVIMRECLTCACVQQGTCLNNICGDRIRSVGEGMGWCVAAAGCSLALLIFCVGIAVGNPITCHGQIWSDVFWAQIMQFVMQLVVNLVMFLLFYYVCPGEAHLDKTKTHPKFPHGLAYPQDMQRFCEGDRWCYKVQARELRTGSSTGAEMVI